MNSYMPMVAQMASAYSENDGTVEVDDLISAGVFGVSDAINSYQPNSQVGFKEFCMSLVKKAMLKELSWANSDMGQALATLTRKKKLIIILRYYEQCPFSDISNLLNIPIETVKNTYHSAISSLPPLPKLL